MNEWLKRNEGVLVGIGSITGVLMIFGQYWVALAFLLGTLYGALLE